MPNGTLLTSIMTAYSMDQARHEFRNRNQYFIWIECASRKMTGQRITCGTSTVNGGSVLFLIAEIPNTTTETTVLTAMVLD